MSRAEPMALARRMALYAPEGRYDGDLTCAQYRRGWHKAQRSGEAIMPSGLARLRHRKARPTPRRADAIAARLARRREAERRD